MDDIAVEPPSNKSNANNLTFNRNLIRSVSKRTDLKSRQSRHSSTKNLREIDTQNIEANHGSDEGSFHSLCSDELADHCEPKDCAGTLTQQKIRAIISDEEISNDADGITSEEGEERCIDVFFPDKNEDEQFEPAYEHPEITGYNVSYNI